LLKFSSRTWSNCRDYHDYR